MFIPAGCAYSKNSTVRTTKRLVKPLRKKEKEPNSDSSRPATSGNQVRMSTEAVGSVILVP